MDPKSQDPRLLTRKEYLVLTVILVGTAALESNCATNGSGGSNGSGGTSGSGVSVSGVCENWFSG